MVDDKMTFCDTHGEIELVLVDEALHRYDCKECQFEKDQENLSPSLISGKRQ